MSDPKKHHYVPEFLLKGWYRQDGRVAVYSRKAGRVVIDWRTPEHTGFEGNLYSISALPEDREWVRAGSDGKARCRPGSSDFEAPAGR